MSDFLEVTDLGRGGLDSVLQLAAAVKNDPAASMGARSGCATSRCAKRPHPGPTSSGSMAGSVNQAASARLGLDRKS